VQSVGLSDAEIIKELALVRAFGEIQNIAPPRLTLILEAAEKEMREKPSPPNPGPTP